MARVLRHARQMRCAHAGAPERLMSGFVLSCDAVELLHMWQIIDSAPLVVLEVVMRLIRLVACDAWLPLTRLSVVSMVCWVYLSCG